MAPSLMRFIPFTKGTSLRSPISIRNNLPGWTTVGNAYGHIEDDQIPLKSQVDVPMANSKHSSRQRQDQFGLGPKHSKYGIKGGWKGGARFAFYTAATVLFINIVLLIVGTTALPWMDSMTMLYIGSCSKTERINAGVHFVVNLLSTCLLAASNYCMQLLSAPTREDVDAAHAAGRWLDVGIPSIRNLRFLKRKKIILWWILAVSSMPLHLLYNSVFFSAIATNNYHVLYATPDFVTGAPYNKTEFPDTDKFKISEHQARASTFDRFGRQECIQAYSQDFVTDRKDVILVVKNVPSTNSSLLKIATDEMPTTGLAPSDNAFAWICDDPLTVEKTDGCCLNEFGFIPCSRMTRKLESISAEWWRSGGFDIDYCLSETFPPDCHEHFAPPIMAPVLFFNIFKAVVIWYVAFRYKDKPLVTVGDAIESFIRNPDPTTKHMCLATHEQIEQNWSKGYIPQPQRYLPQRMRWYKSVTNRQWGLLSTLLVIATVLTSVAIAYGIENLNPSTIQQAWDMGMGTVRQQNLISNLKISHLGSNALFLSALIANTPQALFSFIYLVYTTVFTSMFLGREWDRFATHPKGRLLRVSEPVGDQKSTYLLQIPYRYSIPMLICSGILHWLVSQSIFLANISIIPLSGKKPKTDEITSCAYSVKGMIFVLVVGLFMIVWVAGNGLRSNSGLMVPAGSNSAAISAACHVLGRTGGERDAMVLRPLRWGVTDYGGKSNRNSRSVKWDDQTSTSSTPDLNSISDFGKSTMATSHVRNHSRQPSETSSFITSTAWHHNGGVETAYHGHGYGHNHSDSKSYGNNQNRGHYTRGRSQSDLVDPDNAVGMYDGHGTPSLVAPYSPDELPPPPTPPKDRPEIHPPVPISKYMIPHYSSGNGSDRGRTQRALDDAEYALATGLDKPGHCSFSDSVVGKPVPGRTYS